MKGNYRKPEPLRALDRRPGLRELKRRAFDTMFEKAELTKPKPRPPGTPDNSKERR